MNYDVIVIGAGPGGYVAAIRAAQLGRRVALVEREAVGGVCLNWGCIPTKALLKSATIYRHAKEAAQYGVQIEGEVKPDLKAMVARSRTVAETMSKGIHFLLKKHQIDLLEGFGRLTSPHTVEVEGVSYEAEHIILATGARPRVLPAIPVDGVRIISSKEALTMEQLPASMVVVGTGAIGCELAWFYAALGVQVTLVEYLPRIMPLEDEEVSKAMERAFRKMRVAVLTATTVQSACFVEDHCEVAVEGKKGPATLMADVVLSAVGVVSNTEGLGLEALGVTMERGKVVVDEHYRTSVEGVYAIGDLIATPALAHVASAEAIHCVEAICGLQPAPIDYTTIPSCIFTTPEVSSVGLTEEQARERYGEIKVGRFPFTASGKAMAAGERDGFVKLIFDGEERLVGAHLVGGTVAELIAEPTLAKALGATAHQLARTIHAHPSMNEAVMEAAEEAMGCAIHV